MLTRLEILRISRNVGVGALSVESGISRQHLLRMRKGELQPRRDMIAATVSAFRHLTLEDVQPEDVVELTIEESGPWRRERPHRLTADIEAWTRERDAAHDLLRALQAEPLDGWLAFLSRRAPSDAVVRALLFEGRATIDREPQRARALFAVAAELAENLRGLRREYQLSLVGRAWLELANALRQIGTYTEALSALDEAERRFEGEPYCTKDLGRAWLTRGTIFVKTGDLDRAEHFLRCAINIFAAIDDARRIAKVRMVEAGARFERGDINGARARWISVLPIWKAANERHDLAVTWLNLGHCDVEEQLVAPARAWMDKALHGFERLHCDAEVLRTRWALARVTALFEDRRRGIEALLRVREGLDGAGLTADAGMLMLDVVEALLLPPRRPSAAAEICASLPKFFHAIGAVRTAAKALGYLQEASAAHRLTVPAVRKIRRVLDRALDGWEEPFEVPTEDRRSTGPPSDA